jgi:predicted RNase H-like HicB family nuclease
MKFSIECEREEDGRWLAEVPQLPGVLAYGNTSDEALAKAEVLALRVLAERLEHGEARPVAPTESRVRKHTLLIFTGLAVMLGPIAMFFFMATFPKLFSEGTILFWHYISAFGLILYVPLGLVIFGSVEFRVG